MEINQASEKFRGEEIAPMHTAEHILNGTMVKMFGCQRAHSSHIERKKSKCDYILPAQLVADEVAAIEAKVNEVIAADMPVTFEFAEVGNLRPGRFDLTRLPEDATQTVRIVHIGDYDECLCIGLHVENTSEIGTFKIISHDYKDGIFRMRFKLV